jgi:putative flavoprotein involved in K+ transport
MATEIVETLIVGGGQAGLAMSDMLARRRKSHLIVGRIAERWRTERWDGLRFQFPNRSVRLPDCPFCSSDPDGFATSSEIVVYIEAYAGAGGLGICEGLGHPSHWVVFRSGRGCPRGPGRA